MNIVERIGLLFKYRENISTTIRSKGVDIPEKTKLQNIPQYVDLLEYPEKPKPSDEWSEEFFEQIYNESLSDYIVERSKWNGHVDTIGLREIGWTEDDIQYFQDNGVDWNEEDDELYLVSDYEKELYKTSAITTSNYTSSNISNNADFIVEWRNNIRWMPKWTNAKLSNNVTFRNFSKMIGCPYFDHSNQTTCTNLFSHCYELKCIPPISFKENTLWDGSGMFFACKKIKTIPNTINWEYAKSLNTVFRYCSELMYIPELNVPNVTLLNYSFGECHKLKTVKIITSEKLTNTLGTFEYCKNLKTVPLFNTCNVTTFQNMFLDCESLVNVPCFDIKNCTNLASTFKFCFNLNAIPDMNFTAVTNYNSMCSGCYLIKSVPSTLDFSQTTNIANMFENCINITEFPYKLDLNGGATNASEGIKDYSYFLRNTKITEISFGIYYKSGGDSYILNGVPTIKKLYIDDFIGSTYAFNGSDMYNVEEIGGELKGLRNSISFNGF